MKVRAGQREIKAVYFYPKPENKRIIFTQVAASAERRGLGLYLVGSVRSFLMCSRYLRSSCQFFVGYDGCDCAKGGDGDVAPTHIGGGVEHLLEVHCDLNKNNCC